VSTLDDDNVFAVRRTGGALTLLSQAPVTSQSAGAVDIPHVVPVHNRYGNTRELYSNYPGEVAIKIKTDDPGKPATGATVIANSGLLTLKLTSDIEVARCSLSSSDLTVYETPLIVLFYVEEMVFRSDYWTGGDNKQYDSVTFFWNIPTGDPPPDPAWLTYETTVSRAPDEVLGYVVSQTSYLSMAPNTTGAASIYNGTTSPSGGPFGADQVYALFSSAQTYSDLLVGGTVFESVDHFKVRHDSQASQQGLKAFVTNPAAPFDSPGWAGAAASSAPGTADPKLLWSDIPYTFTPNDSTWIGSTLVCRVKVECQFSYTSPTSCDRLWWPGAKVKLKVTYKKAEVIRTLGTGAGGYSDLKGYTPTLGAWASAGDEEIEVTLPSYSATAQDIGDPWDLEEIDGYVVAIDDIEIIEVTYP
jgi:hypothetical protein